MPTKGSWTPKTPMFAAKSRRIQQNDGLLQRLCPAMNNPHGRVLFGAFQKVGYGATQHTLLGLRAEPARICPMGRCGLPLHPLHSRRDATKTFAGSASFVLGTAGHAVANNSVFLASPISSATNR